MIATPRRVQNSVRAFISRRLKLTRALSYPEYLFVEPTNFCNLKCPLCPTGAGYLGRVPRGYMNIEHYRNLIDELSPYARRIELWGFGEPMMHPEIHTMISYASTNGLRTKISTNGQFFETREDAERIVASRLDKMKLSLDGLSQETLSVYRRNASFEKLIHGIELINEAKLRANSKTPRLILQFIVMKHNEHEVDRAPEFARRMNMTLKIKPVGLSSSDEADEFLPQSDRYSRFSYSKSRTALEPKYSQPSVCPYPWNWAHLNWDGTVVACCKDPRRRYVFGNAFEEGGFTKVWNSPPYVQFRKQYLADRTALDRCRDCVLPPHI
ncbi:MAG: radical SAM protein [Pseudomonadota bacterium]